VGLKKKFFALRASRQNEIAQASMDSLLSLPRKLYSILEQQLRRDDSFIFVGKSHEGLAVASQCDKQTMEVPERPTREFCIQKKSSIANLYKDFPCKKK